MKKSNRKKWIKSITVLGRRWSSKTYGTTYNTFQVHINGGIVHKSGMDSGYGEHYLQRATEWLDAQGYLPGLIHYPNGGCEHLRIYCERYKIKFDYIVNDVARERDL